MFCFWGSRSFLLIVFMNTICVYLIRQAKWSTHFTGKLPYFEKAHEFFLPGYSFIFSFASFHDFWPASVWLLHSSACFERTHSQIPTYLHDLIWWFLITSTFQLFLSQCVCHGMYYGYGHMRSNGSKNSRVGLLLLSKTHLTEHLRYNHQQVWFQLLLSY